VGPKGAASLLNKYGTLEKALAAGRFAAEAEKLRLYRKIATMDEKAPLPPLRTRKPTWAKAAALAWEWRLKKLAERLEELRDRCASSDSLNVTRGSRRSKRQQRVPN
jgi:5'-3' exonuclease